jgi:OOP family OmpA-OmpF porin
MKQLSAAILLLALAAPAFADNEKGLYVGAGLGQFNVKVDDVSDISGVVGGFDADDTSWKIFGGYRFNPFFALELDYIDFGGPNDTVNGTKVESKINGVAPYAIASIPVGIIDLFAKAGYLFYDVKVDVAGARVSSDSDQDFAYGAGVGITVFDHIHARLEYERIEISNADKTDAVWLSGAWRF